MYNAYVRKSQMRTVLLAALYMISPVELRATSDIDVSPGGHVTCLGTLLFPVAPPSTVSPADLCRPIHKHTRYNCNYVIDINATV